MAKKEDSSDTATEPPPPPSAPPPPTRSRGQQLPYELPTMNVPIVVFWILPLFCIAMFSRNIADISPKTIPVNPPTPRPKPAPRKAPTVTAPTKPVVDLPASWPVDYKKQLKIIQKRRRSIPGFSGNIHNELEKLETKPATTSKPKRPSPNAPTANSAAASDTSPRLRLQERIAQLVQDYHDHGDDLLRGIVAADAMRMYDLQYHEGGTYEQPAIALYHALLEKATARREQLKADGKPTKYGLTCNEETTMEYADKSADGLLCALYTSLGKILYMSNMFERAVEAYDGCLKGIDPGYLDAKNSRGSSLIVLGRYAEAGRDFVDVIDMDTKRLFIDAFTGLARVLEAKEEVVEGGWDTVVDPIRQLLPILSPQGQDPNVASVLGRLHHVLFTYNEAKTKEYSTAFHHLSESHKFKLSTLPKWSGEMERMKVQQLQSIFRAGFWDQTTGSTTQVPIFIIGFVRSGSTLLERILDAHPSIAGTGENSVFNGRLDDIRNQIVKASNVGGDLGPVTKRLADEVVAEMERRWKVVDSNTETDHDGSKQPRRLADKMLTNYYNVGFIEMLYPNALILHVAREPMDSIFSAFKHNFPSGTLDYTSDMTGVADLYEAYRAVMDHWDEVLPGRITHIRYEDMVSDFEGVARAIIAATGLPWHDDVLQFHKKKHAVNTYSSTQVRKGIYKSSMKSWMRYEEELKPLVKKVGDRVKFNLKTSVPGYRKPTSQTE